MICKFVDWRLNSIPKYCPLHRQRCFIYFLEKVIHLFLKIMVFYALLNKLEQYCLHFLNQLFSGLFCKFYINHCKYRFVYTELFTIITYLNKTWKFFLGYLFIPPYFKSIKKLFFCLNIEKIILCIQIFNNAIFLNIFAGLRILLN